MRNRRGQRRERRNQVDIPEKRRRARRQQCLPGDGEPGYAAQSERDDPHISKDQYIRQRLPWGAGTWSISWDAARTTTNSLLSSVDPTLESGVELAFSQPLLKDRKIDASRQQYIITTRNHQNAELRLRESAVQTVAAVKRAYWALKASVANVDVQQRSLELAQELARQNRIRVGAGQIPPLDLTQAEVEVAQRRENLIQARTHARGGGSSK